MEATHELVRLENVTKRFGGVCALNDVSFAINKGEVHAVVGENGAGKSTLMKILAGIYLPDSGTVYLRGQPVKLSNPLEARKNGVSIVFQELNQFPHLTATGNIFINREMAGGSGLLNEKEMNAAVRQVFEMMGVDIDPKVLVGSLTVGEKQQVEIARTLQQQSEIIIMDEPNSALTESESRRLFEIIRRLRDSGMTVIYVSHRLEEVFSIADRISVIRDGHYQGTWVTRETTIKKIITAMIGRRLEEAFPNRPPVPAEARTVLEVRDLQQGTSLGPVSFHLREGEILGFAGLEGSGIDCLFHIMFGLEQPTGGEIVYQDKSLRVRNPVEAIRNNWGLIPASRREQGLMMDWSIRRNTTLVILDRLMNRLGLQDSNKERRTTEEYVKKLNVATDNIDKRVVNLSGGNQQKVVVAKWLATGPKMLILNDPTRGVDVGAKSEIYTICDQLAREGLALMFTSSENEETLGVCDRVLIFYRGKVIKEFKRGEASKSDVMHWISGGLEVEEEPTQEPGA